MIYVVQCLDRVDRWLPRMWDHSLAVALTRQLQLEYEAGIPSRVHPFDDQPVTVHPQTTYRGVVNA